MGRDIPELVEATSAPCFLAYRVLYPFDGSPPTPLQVTIEDPQVPDLNDCAAALVRALPGAGVHTLSPQAWRRFVRRLEGCKKLDQSSCSTSALR